MNQKIHIFFYTVLVLALMGMTAIAAFLFGKLKTEPVTSNQTNQVINENTNIPTQNTNTTPPNINGATGPKNDLTEHDTWVTFSVDPTAFEEGELIAESASVPDVLVCDNSIETKVCEADEILVYFVNTAGFKNPGDEQIAVIRSTDGGETWTERESIVISGKDDNLGAVDPSVVLLEDGRMRLYFFGSTVQAGDPASIKGEHKIYSAISTDGINFTLEDGERLSREKITDPEVVLWNGAWYMLYSEGPNSGLAVSSDGLTFEDKELISPSFGGVPGLVVNDDGLLGYGCQQGIMSALSTDGATFTRNTSAALTVTEGTLCDPAVDAFQNEYVMVYKTAPAQTFNGSNNPLPPLNSNVQQQ